MALLDRAIFAGAAKPGSLQGRIPTESAMAAGS
jgi:hypothetical protein